MHNLKMSGFENEDYQKADFQRAETGGAGALSFWGGKNRVF